MEPSKKKARRDLILDPPSAARVVPLQLRLKVPAKTQKEEKSAAEPELVERVFRCQATRINEDGKDYYVTVYHILRGSDPAGPIKLFGPGGQLVPAYWDEDLDILVLASAADAAKPPSSSNGGAFSLSSTLQLPLLEKVVVLGRGLLGVSIDDDIVATDAQVSGMHPAWSYYTLNVRCQKGACGSAFFRPDAPDVLLGVLVRNIKETVSVLKRKEDNVYEENDPPLVVHVAAGAALFIPAAFYLDVIRDRRQSRAKRPRAQSAADTAAAEEDLELGGSVVLTDELEDLVEVDTFQPSYTEELIAEGE